MHLLVFLALFAHGRAVAAPRSIPTPQSVMWIGAHPDDEVLAAPLLATWCRDQHARCTIVTLTRGEAGVCLKPAGCAPDLATTRAAEEGAASQYFGAALVLLTLPNGDGASPPPWSGVSLAPIIDAFAPDVIVTFDPHHGSTGHPDHIATANLVLEAVRDRSRVYFIETLVDPATFAFRPAFSSAIRYEAHWDAIVDVMQRYPSQFDAPIIDAVRNATQRAVFLAPAVAAVP